jgi:VanZ family protein
VLKPLFFWLATFWTLAIIFLCLAKFGSMPKVGLQNADKYVHFTFHFVFVVLWFLYFNTKTENRINLNTILKVFLMSFVFGFLIEIAQFLFTKTRGYDLLDVLANTTGAFVASLLIRVVQLLKMKKGY